MTAWIRTVEEDAAVGKLAEAYGKVANARGTVANIWRAHSLNPDALEAHLTLYQTLLYGKTGLSRREREMVAVAVAKANGCHYCLSHHADALGRYVKEPGLVPLVASDYTKAPLQPRERALMDYCMKLSQHPDKMTKVDVDALKGHGFTDEEVLDAALVTGYFNFVNRVTVGLGVSSEDAEKSYKY
ncbi:MAG TPA: peroxidase-related enzyme [Candidatus Thermoplasmatota archaeon]|nr:peroxidase-related enzyme [Candidatus Thermoplasmatota archaeon]